MPEDVQGAVHYESQDLLSKRYALSLRVVASDLRTNVDIAYHWATLPGSLETE